MKKKSSTEKLLTFILATSLTIIGFIVIPPLIDKYANKVYRASLKKKEIDYDDMGPEIIPNDKED